MLGQKDGQVQLLRQHVQQLRLGDGAQPHQVQAQQAAVLTLQGQGVDQIRLADHAARHQLLAQATTRRGGGEGDDHGGGVGVC